MNDSAGPALLRLPDTIEGIHVIECNHLGWRSFQYRFPASRCKRIRRKFAKRYQRRVQDPVAHLVSSPFSWGEPTLVANAAAIAQIKKAIQAKVAR